MVASSSTSVAVRGAAWSERSRLAVPRSPGTRPYRANAIASSSVVLPAPVSPCSRNRPLQVVEGHLLGRGERAEGRHAEPVRAHQRSPSSPAAVKRGGEQLALGVGGVGVPHVPHELGGDRQVVAALDLLPVAAQVGGEALRLELEREDVREPGAEPVHRPLGAGGVGEGHRDEVVLAPVVLGRGEQVVDAPGQRGQPPVDGGRDPLRAGLAARGDPRPARLPFSWSFSENE